MVTTIPDGYELLEERAASYKRLTAKGTISEHARGYATDIHSLMHILDMNRQKEEFGPRWDETYRHADARETMRVFHNDKYARIQFALSDEENYLVPATPQGALQHFSMRGFLFNPSKFPGPMLYKTGFVSQEEFDAANGSPMDRIILADDCILPVKKMLEAATPIIEGNNRLLRVNDPEQNPIVAARYKGVPNPSENAIGSIIYLRRKPGAEREEETEIFTFADSSMYDADRKTLWAESEYKEEIGKLIEYQRVLDRVRTRLDIDYRRDKSAEVKDAAWEHAVGVMTNVEHELRNVQATQKVEARDFLSKAAQQLTVKNKPKISPAMAQITASLTRIDNRLKEINGKGGANVEDRLLLEAQIRRGENALLAVRYRVMDAANGTASLADIRKELELDMKELEKITLRPLSVYAQAMIRQIQGLRINHTITFQEDLLTLHIIGKLQGIRTSGERIRARSAQTGMIDFAHEAKIANDVKNALSTEQIYPSMKTHRTNLVMEEACERWEDLIAFLEKRAAFEYGDLPKEKEELDRLVESLGVEHAAESIVSWLPEAVPYAPPFRLRADEKMHA